MFKSIIYKEWIKIRLVVYASLGLGLLALINIFLNVRHDMIFDEPANYWYGFLFKGYIYFGILRFLPFLIGGGIAIAQYFPETVNKRIKLTFHLPFNENGLLIRMHAFGAGVIAAIYAVFILLFIAGSTIYFPAEIITDSLLTLAPWFLGGLTTYFLLALILMEPMWLYRAFYAVISAGFVTVFYIRCSIGGYSHLLGLLALLTLLLSCVVLFSGYRFRKGEM